MRLMNMLERSFAAVAFAERGLAEDAEMILKGTDRQPKAAGRARTTVRATPRPRVRA